jgi:hypothetical protein
LHHLVGSSLFVRTVLAALLASSMSIAHAAAPLHPPSGAIVLDTVASGVQIYQCEYDTNRQLDWVFKSPRATLYDAAGRVVIEHSAGPTWQANDGSRITGQVIAQAPSDETDSVPQLLLHAKSVGSNGVLSPILYVQRIKTRGGAKPTAICSAEHQVGSSPYLAEYRFFK